MFTRNKPLTILLALSILVASFLTTIAPTSTALAGGQQSITLTITYVDNTATWPDRDGYGVAIHARVNAVGYQGSTIKLAVFFKYYSDERWAKKSNGQYLSSTMNLVPTYDNTTWSDATFWFPYQSFYNTRDGRSPVFYAELQAKSPGASKYNVFSSDLQFAVPVRID